MSFQKGHLELTLAEVLQIIRAWLREYEMHNAHIRIGQQFGPLVRDQVLFTIDVVQVAMPASADASASTTGETVVDMRGLPEHELSPYDRLEVTEMSGAEPVADETPGI